MCVCVMHCLVIDTAQNHQRGCNNLNRLTTIPNQKSESPTLYGIGIVSYTVPGTVVTVSCDGGYYRYQKFYNTQKQLYFVVPQHYGLFCNSYM